MALSFMIIFFFLRLASSGFDVTLDKIREWFSSYLLASPLGEVFLDDWGKLDVETSFLLYSIEGIGGIFLRNNNKMKICQIFPWNLWIQIFCSKNFAKMQIFKILLKDSSCQHVFPSPGSPWFIFQSWKMPQYFPLLIQQQFRNKFGWFVKW